MLNRRRFVGAVAATLAVGPRVHAAERGEKVFRIGYLAPNSPESSLDNAAAFRQVLRGRGWIEGRNIRFDYRYAEGRVERLPALARELAALPVDVIVAGASSATQAAKDATTSIPIVMAASADAVGEGFVTSLARPGGNITGVTFFAGSEVAGKQLELLRQLAPKAPRVGVLANPGNASHAGFTRDLKRAAPALGIDILVVEARQPDELAGAFAAIAKERAGAVLVLTDSMFFGERRSVVGLAAANALPAMYSQRAFVDTGGLVSYGPNLTEMFRRAANYVDRILRGAKPNELPVEQPTKFELIVNAKTAKTLGVAIPQSVLLRADQMVE